ncbi:MAG TPA: hypothetical protein PKY25_02380 [Bacilli bacterium]|nr:hypothetical protein [Bacilli bacterium]
METRTGKYSSSSDSEIGERTKKNEELYESVDEEIYSDPKYNNTSILESAKEININKLKDMIDNKENDYEIGKYRTKPVYDDDKKSIIEEETVRDINEILELAKKKRKFIEEAIEKDKYADSNYNEYKKDDEKEEYREEKHEKDEDTTTTALNILSDLKPTENTIITDPIESDLEKEFTDKGTEYSDSLIFTNNDFEDVNESIKRDTKIVKVVIILMVIVLLLIGAYAYWYFILNK